MPNNPLSLAIIGGGNMGGALAVGLAAKAEQAHLTITVTARHASTLERLRNEAPSLRTTLDNEEAVQGAEVIILAVKPWLVEEVVGEIKPLLKGKVLCSLAAGIGTERLSAWSGQPTYYGMPNIAARVGESMTFLAPPAGADEETTTRVAHLFSLVGRVEVCEERLLAPGMMMGGCGIAYVLRYLRAQTEAGVEMGFRPDEALRIAMQTMQGAVALLEHTHAHPEALIDQVTTPGGTTIKGLNALDHAGFNSAVIRSLKAGL